MILLRYWAGPPKPQWRCECEEQLVTLYPDAEIVEYNGKALYNMMHSGCWRIEKCSEHPDTLWVDNDVWLDAKLPLSDKPGMVYEYNIPHWSIVWSGKHPEIFTGLSAMQASRKITELHKRGQADLYSLSGTHWATDASGCKARR